MTITRKEFIKNISVVTLGFISFSKLISSSNVVNKLLFQNELIKDPNGVLDLPKGFSYKIISKLGDEMDDGLVVPDAADIRGGLADMPRQLAKALQAMLERRELACL